MKNEIEHDVKTEEGFKLIVYVKKEEYINVISDRFDKGYFMEKIEDKLIHKISEMVQEEIYEKVLNKIDIDSIAKATSVRMIQNMSR